MRYLSFMGFLLLAACGQSGDLYLPPDPPEPVPPAAEAPAADEEKKKEPPKEGP